jgi:hypothetical protein
METQHLRTPEESSVVELLEEFSDVSEVINARDAMPTSPDFVEPVWETKTRVAGPVPAFIQELMVRTPAGGVWVDEVLARLDAAEDDRASSSHVRCVASSVDYASNDTSEADEDDPTLLFDPIPVTIEAPEPRPDEPGELVSARDVTALTAAFASVPRLGRPRPPHAALPSGCGTAQSFPLQVPAAAGAQPVRPADWTPRSKPTVTLPRVEPRDSAWRIFFLFALVMFIDGVALGVAYWQFILNAPR